MLDQNTDRMWYVIGAVIVGAAIIALANGGLSQLFASVTNNFEEAAHLSVEGVQHITGPPNLLPDYALDEVEGGTYIESDGDRYSNGDQSDEFIRHVNLSPIFDEQGPGHTYTLKFDIKSLDTSVYDQVRIYMQNGSDQRYAFRPPPNVTVTEDYQTITLTGLEPQLSDSSVDASHLAFYGTYGTGNVPIVKNVKLYLEQ